MNVDVTSASAGFLLGSAVITFLARWIFATKNDLVKAKDAAIEEAKKILGAHVTQESEDLRRLFDKLDKMADGMADLRVKVAELRYSRGQQPGDRPPGSDSSTFPRVR